jgi:predicted phage replisome organizer/uncharacterized phage protein (TIGR02220 family)
MAETKKYYWLKLKEDFFKDKEIKKLRRIAGGDTYTIIYLKLLLLGLRDDCRLYFEGIEDTFVEELALELDEDTENVKVTLAFLLRMGMIQEVSETELYLARLPECIGKETSKAELMRKKRAREKAGFLESGNNVTEALPPVTFCYTEIEEEKEREKETEEEEEKEEKKKGTEKSINYQKIVDVYHHTCLSYPKVRALSDARKKTIKARFNNGYTLEDFQEVFTKAENSSFLKGKNNREWSATFDWLIKDSNFAKVLDGNYDDKKTEKATDNPYAHLKGVTTL